MHKVDRMPLRELINEIAELEARGPEDALDGLYMAVLKAEYNLRNAIAHKEKEKRLDILKMRKRQAIHEYDSARWNGLPELLKERKRHEVDSKSQKPGRRRNDQQRDRSGQPG